MKKVIRLNESDLIRIVKRVLKEETKPAEDITGPNSACRKAVTWKLMWEAKQWWIDRLSIVGTDGKRIPNINIMSKILYQKYKITDLKSLLKKDPQKGKKYFKEASDLVMQAVDFVKNIKFVFEGYGTKGSDNLTGAMWVNVSDKQTVHINCKEFSNPKYQKDNSFIKDALVHEIQHSIDQFFGYEIKFKSDTGFFTPEDFELIRKTYDWSQKPMTNDKITYMVREPEPPIKKDKGNKYSDYGLNFPSEDIYYDKSYLKKWPEFNQKRYNCDSTEIQSRYTETKRILGLPPSANLTINHLKSNGEAYLEFQRNLFCWASRTDNVSLDTFMKNINLIVAKNQGNKQDLKTKNIA